MCGICGIIDNTQSKKVNLDILKNMAKTLYHRGPDDFSYYYDGNIGLGFTRLSIIDLSSGMQPMFNEDESIILICNGEIFNYIELRKDLLEKGHHFRTKSDIEVIIHLYEEYKDGLFEYLNGQFAFMLCDKKNKTFLCSRDHFGIAPFFYTVQEDLFIFSSEIKAILQHPSVVREVDTIGLDQVFTFPGLISPRTMFKNIKSLESGHYLKIDNKGNIKENEFWDLYYPEEKDIEYDKSEDYYINKLNELITESIKIRMRADVPIGFYLSGGVDSSLIAAKIHEIDLLNKKYVNRFSFSIDFEDHVLSESKFQKMMVKKVKSSHNEKLFLYNDISNKLSRAIYHCECPIKESYNTASMALSEMVRNNKIKVILTGEGADELFAGYIGYRFDVMRKMQLSISVGGRNELDLEMNKKLWGSEDYFYERNYYTFNSIKNDIYSDDINNNYDKVNCLNFFVLDNKKIINRNVIHKRSYIDFKLRLADHLISDHGDRMAFANSVEARYPFLDKNIINFTALIPPDLKLRNMQEKYILRQIAKQYLPIEIVNREKFGFVAPGSPFLLQNNFEYINDILSYKLIKKQGFFNPDKVEELKKVYSKPGFSVNVPFEDDLLIIIITFGILLEQFDLPDFSC